MCKYLWHPNKFRIKWDFSCGPQQCSFRFYGLLVGWMCPQRDLFSAQDPHAEETAHWYLLNCRIKAFVAFMAVVPKKHFCPKKGKLDSHFWCTRIVSYRLISVSCLPQEMKNSYSWKEKERNPVHQLQTIAFPN